MGTACLNRPYTAAVVFLVDAGRAHVRDSAVDIVQTNVDLTALVTFKHLGLIIASYRLLWPPALIIRPIIRVIIGS